jgi:hypothetical protein
VVANWLILAERAIAGYPEVEWQVVEASRQYDEEDDIGESMGSDNSKERSCPVTSVAEQYPHHEHKSNLQSRSVSHMH